MGEEPDAGRAELRPELGMRRESIESRAHSAAENTSSGGFYEVLACPPLRRSRGVAEIEKIA
jgi:hypothetical protein